MANEAAKTILFDAALKAEKEYWLARLSGESLRASIRKDRDGAGGDLGRFELTFPAQVAGTLNRVATGMPLLTYAALVGAIEGCLYRWSGIARVALGSPALRGADEAANADNTVVLVGAVSPADSFRKLLLETRQTLLDAYARQRYPFARVIRDLGIQPDLRCPLFDAVVSLEGLHGRATCATPDLDLHFVASPTVLSCRVSYRIGAFDEATLRRFLAHVGEFLSDGLANPDCPVSSLAMLTADELERIRRANQTADDTDVDRCLHQLFEEQARLQPQATALLFATEASDFRDGTTLTYGELDERADVLAAFLRGRGVGPEVCVALYAQPSPDLMVAVLAVLKAGGAYVPIDPNYPQERMALMLEDCGAAVLLTDEHMQRSLPASLPAGVRVARLDQPLPPADPTPARWRPASSANIAYVIYTSGSTGTPKGVLVPHRGAVNLVLHAAGLHGVTARSRVLQQASLSFDASVLEIFMTLSQGATLLPVERRVLLSPPALARLIDRQQVTTLCVTPSVLEILPREPFPSLEGISVGGEPSSPAAIQHWVGRRLLNVYAPTEATIFSTAHRCRGAYQGSPPLGQPIGNVQLHVLDGALNPVPVGVTGEAYIGGVGVTRGYLGLPALTATQFVPDPFSAAPGARMYRTGDLVRRIADDDVEFVGRVDHQVKVRGFRIELGEIESVLAKHPQVQEAVVVAREDTPGDKRLVAYVVPAQVAEGDAAKPVQQVDDASLAHLEHWQVLYDETYASARPEDPVFDHSGWVSSYSGKPIAAGEMREWLDDGVAEILAAKPSRVLELGCGSGMVLFRVAPEVKEYVATDFSSSALVGLEREVRRPERGLDHVTLLHRRADDREGIAERAFDTVILNSVVQYFPDTAYLVKVLEGAVAATRPGGVVFLGDVRSHALLPTQHLSVQLHQAPSALRIDELNERIRAAVGREEELVVDPDFFMVLRTELPRIAHVEVIPKRAKHHNELTRFRYQVVLHIESDVPALADLAWRDWKESGLTLASLEAALRESTQPVRAISDIPNARLSRERSAQALISSDGCPKTVGELRTLITTSQVEGADPEELFAIAARTGHELRLSWFRHGADGAFAALFYRPDVVGARPIVPYRGEWSGKDALDRFTNHPARAQRAYSLPTQLRRHVQRSLPEAMVPSVFVELTELPRTAHGKLNRAALPAPGRDRGSVTSEYVAPRSETERIVAGVWQEVLGTERVGLHDNFFELGGHSLLMVRVHSRLRERFPGGLALVDLFSHPTVESLAKYIHDGLGREQTAQAPAEPPAAIATPAPSAAPADAPPSNDIAIIAMACRYPGARSTEEFWHLLRAGREGTREFTVEELSAAGVDAATLASPRYVRRAGVLDDVELFDAQFFGYAAREAQMMDPQQRIFLEGSWEALERAGYDAEQFDGKVAVFAGVGMNTYFVWNLLANRELLESMGAFQTMLGNSNDLLTTRVSYQLNLTGPSVAVQTGCSTSLVAVHLACQSLLDGESDMALAGGVAILIPQEQGYEYVEGGVCSEDGRCRAFDARATGTVPGRGMGVVVLRRLADAVAAGDPIYAVIKGSAINNDGSAKVGYTAPSVPGQKQAVAAALDAAGVTPETIAYVEAHGTATAAGDPIEVAALTEAYRAHTSATNFCAIGSLKTNIGHPDMSSGVAGLIKCALSLSNGEIPASLHFEQPNPNIDFAGGPFYVNTRLSPWPRRPARAAVNSLGIGGTNAHVILEEPPAPTASGPSRPWQLLTLSAKTPDALAAASERLARHLRAHPELPLADVAHTLRVGRRALAHRRAIVCRTHEEAAARLEGQKEATFTDGRNRAVVFLFPGQGAQHAEMARGLYEHEPVFRRAVDECAALALEPLTLDLRRLLFPSAYGETEAWAEERLAETAYTQPALFVVEYALATLWLSWGIRPSMMLGHSVGEFVAACLAGVFTLKDALALVIERGRLMQALAPGAMLAVPLDEDQAVARARGRLSVSAVNGPKQCVLAGPVDMVQEVQDELRAAGIEGRRLDVTRAFHSQMVDEALPAFRRAVEVTTRGRLQTPVVSCTTGHRLTDSDVLDSEYWIRHLRQPVRFGAALDTVLQDKDCIVLEVGPNQTLTGLARRHPASAGHLIVASLPRRGSDVPDQQQVLQTLAGAWLGGAQPDFHAFVAHERRGRVLLPTYPFARTRHWLDAKSPPAQGRTAGMASPGARPISYTSWRQSAATAAASNVAQRLLVVATGSALADALAERAAEQGWSVARAAAALDAEGWRSVWAAEPRPQHVVCVLEDPQVGLALVHALAGGVPAGEAPPELTLACPGLEAPDGDALPPGGASIAGTAALYPGRVRFVDVGPLAGGNAVRRRAEQLLAQLGRHELRTAYRGKQRWVADEEAAPDIGVEPVAGTYLVVGDLTGPTWWFARAWAARPGSRLIIQGSGPAAKLLELESAGAAIVTVSPETLPAALQETGAVTAAAVTLAPDRDPASPGDCVAAIEGELARLAGVVEALRDHQVGQWLVQTFEPPAVMGLARALALGLAAAVERAVRVADGEGDGRWLAAHWRGWSDGTATLADAGGEALSAAEVEAVYRRILALDGVGTVRVVAEPPAAAVAVAEAALQSERPQGLPDYVAPQSPTEEKLAALWSQYLGYSRIGRDDNFFDLGGHSLLATQVVARLREALNVELPLKRFFENATIALLAPCLATAEIASGPALTPIPRMARDRPLPLSFPQQRMWFFEQLEPGSSTYTVPGCIRLRLPLDVEALRRTLAEIVQRHESLRTTFHVVDGQPVQVIAPRMELPLPVHDLTGLPEAERYGRALEIATAETRRPFDLAAGPLLRATLIKCGPEDFVLQMSMHHIVSDGWSLGVFIRELSALYEAFRQGQPSPFEPLSIQYADFACWQRDWLGGAGVDQQIAYWRERLASLPPALDLPIARPRPATQTYNGSTVSFRIDAEAASGLRGALKVAQGEGATLFMTLLAVYGALLGRWGRREDLLVGSPIANRGRTELGGLIGFFANTLALRVDLSGDPSFRELLGRVRETAFGAYANQDLPFERLIEELRIERDLSRPVLFDTMLILQNAPLSASNVESLKIEAVPLEKGSAQFDMSWYFTENESGLACTVEYNTDLFSQRSIERLAAHFQRLLACVAADPDLPMSQHALVTPDEARELAPLDRTAALPAGRDVMVHELFEAQVCKTPDAVAITHGEVAWTYRELDERANQWARHLRGLGVRRESRVAICFPRSPDLVAAVMGVLKAGGTFVPLDPQYPVSRLNVIVQQAAPAIIAAEPRDGLQAPAGGLLLDLRRDAPPRGPAAPLGLTGNPSQLAHILYTSGSTGTPKGVAIEHRSVVAMLRWAHREFSAEDLAAVLFSTSLCFDLSIFELFVPLTCGGRVVVVENVLELMRLPENAGVTLINSVPSAVSELAHAGALPESVRVVNLAGEALPVTLVDELHRRPHIQRILNLYGPTEDTVYSTFGALPAGETHIGRPIDGTRACLLDDNLQPVPVGAAGELYLAGAGLARGYADQPALTADRFVPDPYGSPGARMYRTGDLVRLREDGNLDFLGRVDNQIKLRGFRIELGEIENALLGQDSVREVAVIARANGAERELAAFVVPTSLAHPVEDVGEHLSHWQTVWDQTFDQPGGGEGAGHVGWISSIDGQPIPADEMREFFGQFGARLRALPHDAVLEIGCGDGRILEQLAASGGNARPGRYLGTDLSEAALARVRERFGQDYNGVELELRRQGAESFAGIARGSFDLAVVHSVTQYWPSLDYALEVLRGAVGAVRTGGHLVVGDVRNLRSLRQLVTSIVLAGAPPDRSLADLRQQIDERIAREEELLIDPRLFVELGRHVPGVASVEIQVKDGQAHNELTRHRYDVVIGIGEPSPRKWAVEWLDARGTVLSAVDLARLLRDQRSPLAVRAVPDARLAEERAVERLLASGDLGTVRELRERLAASAPDGLEPSVFRALAVETGRAVEVRPSREAGCCDVIFAAPGESTLAVALPEEVEPAHLERWANHPMGVAEMRRARRELGWRLRDRLAERLPAHFVPNSFVVVDSLPRSPNGKVDRAAIGRLDSERTASRAVWQAPKTETEIALAALWGEALGVARLGNNDNFFELGGHSLLMARLLHRIEEHFGVKLPLRRLFELPRLGSFAAEIDRVRAGGAAGAAEQAADYAADSTLAADVQVHPNLAPARAPAREILLTGATGFVGCFLIDQLLRQSDATVHCLVRARNASEALTRLRDRLTHFGLTEAAESPRLVALVGDLAEPRLGMSEAAHDRLAETVDAIVHNGALVNFIYPYEALRATNVGGTEQVLRLATRRRLKPVHYVSTLGVFGGLGAGTFREDHAFSQISARGAYSRSKWVAERLIEAARGRSVPASVYRLGTVTGHSLTGVANDGDFLSRLIRGCIQLGIAPQVSFTQDMTPVDYVAQAIVRLAFPAGPRAEARHTYHLVSADRFTWPDLVRSLAALGHRIRVVPAAEWLAAVEGEASRGSQNPLVPLLPMLTSTLGEAASADLGVVGGEEQGQMVFDTASTDRALAGTGVACPRLDAHLLATYFGRGPRASAPARRSGAALIEEG